MTRGIDFDPYRVFQLTLSPANVTVTASSVEQTFTVNGLKTTDMIVSVSKPTAQTGLGIVGWRVSAANTLAITFMNATGSSIQPTASEKYLVFAIRPDALETDGNVQFR
jgi:hypothetical protein